MHYSHILWDFNGTLFDDVQVNIDTVNAMLARREMDIVTSKTAYHRVFGFPIIDYYRRLGFDLEKESYDDIAGEWAQDYKRFSKNATLYPGIVTKLQEIKAAGIPQIVYSASQKEMLTQQLASLGVLSCFDELLALDTLHAYSKLDIGKAWFSRTKPAHAVLLGDTKHDFDVASEIGIDCILIANGHARNDALKGLPCPVYRDIRDVPLLQ